MSFSQYQYASVDYTRRLLPVKSNHSLVGYFFHYYMTIERIPLL